MPRKKTTKLDAKKVRTYFIECRQLTNDSVARATAEMINDEVITADAARKINSILEAVITDSFSRVMANKNL